VPLAQEPPLQGVFAGEIEQPEAYERYENARTGNQRHGHDQAGKKHGQAQEVSRDQQRDPKNGVPLPKMRLGRSADEVVVGQPQHHRESEPEREEHEESAEPHTGRPAKRLEVVKPLCNTMDHARDTSNGS